MAGTRAQVRQERAANEAAVNGFNGHGSRQLTRRSSAPSGRALVGGLLVAAAAVGLYAAYTRADEGPTETYIVAGRDLAAGTRLTLADLALEAADLPPGLRQRAFRDGSAVIGSTLITPLAEGELVQASAVVAKPSGPASRELTFPVDRDGLPGSLEAGERVDVLATYGTGPEAFTLVVSRGVQLVTLEPGQGRLGQDNTLVATVALDTGDEALALAHAVALAKLAVVRSTGASPLPPSAGYRQPAPPAVASPAPASTGPAPAGPAPSPTGPSPTGPSPTGPSPTGPSPTGPGPAPTGPGPSVTVAGRP